MGIVLLAHFAAGGGPPLDLPAWALAYAVFAILVVAVLVSRQRHVVGSSKSPPPGTVGGDQAETTRRHDPARLVLPVVSAVVFWGFVAMCWFGPSSLGSNIGPLAMVGVLWSLGGWVALAAGWCWEALDPFVVFAPRRPHDRHDRVFPTWSPVPVFASWVIVWVAWVAGDEPRHLAVWATTYGVAMIVVARFGGRAALRAANPLPAALDLTAAITRPGRARTRAGTVEARARIGLIAVMLLGAIGANRMASAKWFASNVRTHGDLAATTVTMTAFVVLSSAIALVWRLGERLVESARRSPGSRPFAAALGPAAGSVLLTQALPSGLVQIQNFLVLASDPFARGWNLFGTVYWQISPQLLSPWVQGIVQVGALAAGHLATLWMLGRAATEPVDGRSAKASVRNRCWNAALVSMGATILGGIVWTLALLG